MLKFTRNFSQISVVGSDIQSSLGGYLFLYPKPDIPDNHTEANTTSSSSSSPPLSSVFPSSTTGGIFDATSLVSYFMTSSTSGASAISDIDEESMDMMEYIIIGIGVILFLVGVYLVVFLVVWLKRKRRIKRQSQMIDLELLKGTESMLFEKFEC
jgi:hypothetical protein